VREELERIWKEGAVTRVDAWTVPALHLTDCNSPTLNPKVGTPLSVGSPQVLVFVRESSVSSPLISQHLHIFSHRDLSSVSNKLHAIVSNMLLLVYFSSASPRHVLKLDCDPLLAFQHTGIYSYLPQLCIVFDVLAPLCMSASEQWDHRVLQHEMLVCRLAYGTRFLAWYNPGALASHFTREHGLW
jgi:hypothetical protein